MNIVKLGLSAAALAGSLVLAAPEASAMPVAPAAAASVAPGADLQEVRLICGPYRCFRRFGYYRRPFVRRFYGWRRPFYHRRPFVRRFYY